MTFQEKAWTHFFHSPHLKATFSSSSLPAPPPPSSLLPSLPLTALHTNSLHWHLRGSRSPAPLPHVCWNLLDVLPPVVHWHIHLCLLPHLCLSSHLLLASRPSCLVGCRISQRLSLSLLPRLCPAPWPPPFIMPPPFVVPVLSGKLRMTYWLLTKEERRK